MARTETVKGVTYVMLDSVDDVTEEVLKIAEEVESGWFEDEPKIDWESFIDRLANYGKYADVPFDIDQYDNPAVRKIQKHIRYIRRYHD